MIELEPQYLNIPPTVLEPYALTIVELSPQFVIRPDFMFLKGCKDCWIEQILVNGEKLFEMKGVVDCRFWSERKPGSRVPGNEFPICPALEVGSKLTLVIFNQTEEKRTLSGFITGMGFS